MKIELKNIGKHEEFEIELPAPGAYFLKGPNGSGKSTVLDAVLGANKLCKMPSLTWGIVKKGSVQVGGLFAKVGANVRISGAPSVKVAPLARILDLSDPGIADPKRAEKARQKAFAALTGATATPADMLGAPMSGGATDLPTAADQARGEANSRALTLERLAASKAGEVSVIKANLPDAAECVSISEAEDALSKALADSDTVRATNAARVSMEAQQARARDGRGERPDVDAAVADVADCAKVVETITTRVEELASLLAQAKIEQATAWSEHSTAMSNMHRARQQADEYDRLTALLSEPIEGATSDEVEAAVSRVREARDVLVVAHDQAKRANLLESIKTVTSEEEVAASEAKAWRDEAKSGISARVAKALASIDAPGWGITDELMCADPDRDGEMVPFSALSDGRRLAAAVDLSLRGDHDAAFLVLPQERGSQLDGKAWTNLSAMAGERGVYILSAVLGEGDIELVTV